MLKRKGIKHEVLNAKYHAKEAEIVAQAGKLGAVTIATNMAGRGTDIMLGGNAEFLAKAEMRKREYPEEIITEAIGYADTDNQEVLDARAVYQNCTNSSAKKSRKRHRQSRRLEVCTFWVQNVMNPAVSITSCVVVPAVRVTRVKAASSCR